MLSEKLKGKFIVLEGIDFSGKTTQGKALVEWLKGEGVDAFFTWEPSDSAPGKLLRSILRKEVELSPTLYESDFHSVLALLFFADRFHHVADELMPAIDEGRTIVCDRYILSTLAYEAGNFGENPTPSWLARIGTPLPAPDLTIFFQIDPEEAIKRAPGRTDQEEEIFDKLASMKRTAANYLEAIDYLGHNHNTTIIDASKDPDEVLAQAKKVIKDYAEQPQPPR